MKRRLLWCDAEANFGRLQNRRSVSELVQKALSAHIDTLIVDVKPLSGEVLFKSSIAPRFTTPDFPGHPESFDLLQIMIEEGHRAGITIHAGINVFSEGHRQWGRGPAFLNPEWQIMSIEPIREVQIGENHLELEVFDPWDLTDSPAVYTQKSGKQIITVPGRVYIVLSESQVEDVIEGDSIAVDIPQDGCVLVMLQSIELGILPGSKVLWNINQTIRKAVDSHIPSWGIFVNPIGPAAAYELRIIREIISKYTIDGITLDRMRYPNIFADFSNKSLEAFSKSIGEGETVSPDDILAHDPRPWKPYIKGALFNKWLEWRANQISDFAAKTVHTIKDSAKDIEVGVYVGSWYDSYYDVGVNWGSPDTKLRYGWMTEGYRNAGYAQLFDYICAGCYYPDVTKKDAKNRNRPEGASVEASCDLANQAIAGATQVYGSLYLREYEDSHHDFMRALQMAESKTDGIMLFDLVYLDRYNWWQTLSGEVRCP